jgi:hypothetical protein
MAKSQADAAVVRYLVIQALLAGAIGLCLAALMLIADTAGVQTHTVASGVSTVGLFVAGTLLTVWPLAFATAVALLSRFEPP